MNINRHARRDWAIAYRINRGVEVALPEYTDERIEVAVDLVIGHGWEPARAATRAGVNYGSLRARLSELSAVAA